MKVELVTDTRGTPIGAAIDAAGVRKTALGPAALADIPPYVGLPPMVPVVVDRAYDSDSLRGHLAARGFPCSCRPTATAGCGPRPTTAVACGGTSWR